MINGLDDGSSQVTGVSLQQENGLDCFKGRQVTGVSLREETAWNKDE